MAKKKPASDSAPQIEQDDGTPFGVTRETMLGDLMQVIKQELHAQTEPWQRMNENDQASALARIEKNVRGAIEEAVRILATENRPVIMATVEAVQFKDGIKATIKLPKGSPERHHLADSTGAQVMIVVAGAADYMGGAAEVKPDPVQASLLLKDIANGKAGTLDDADQKFSDNLRIFGYVVPAAIVASWSKKERLEIAKFLGGETDKPEPASIRPYGISMLRVKFIVSEGVGTDTQIGVWARTAIEAEAIYRERYEIPADKPLDCRPAIGDDDVLACLNPDEAPKAQVDKPPADGTRPDIPPRDPPPKKDGDGSSSTDGTEPPQ